MYPAFTATSNHRRYRGQVDAKARTVAVVVAVAIALAIGVALAAGGGERAPVGGDAPSPSVSAPTTEPAPSASPSEPSGPPLLLPNMRSLDAGNLQIEVVGNTRRLRFSASLANLGPGPLLLRPRRGPGCPRAQQLASSARF